MKNLDQRRLPGRDLPDPSMVTSIMGKQACKSVKDVPGDIDVAFGHLAVRRVR